MAKQGARVTYMVSLPISELLEIVVLRENTGGDQTANRPRNDSWVKSIERGLTRKLGGRDLASRERARYVLFPFTGNIPEETQEQ